MEFSRARRSTTALEHPDDHPRKVALLEFIGEEGLECFLECMPVLTFFGTTTNVLQRDDATVLDTLVEILKLLLPRRFDLSAILDHRSELSFDLSVCSICKR